MGDEDVKFLHEIEIDFTHPGMHFLAAIAVAIIVYMLYLSTLKRAIAGPTFNNNSTGLNGANFQVGPDGTQRGPIAVGEGPDGIGAY